MYFVLQLKKSAKIFASQFTPCIYNAGLSWLVSQVYIYTQIIVFYPPVLFLVDELVS